MGIYSKWPKHGDSVGDVGKYAPVRIWWCAATMHQCVFDIKMVKTKAA